MDTTTFIILFGVIFIVVVGIADLVSIRLLGQWLGVRIQSTFYRRAHIFPSLPLSLHHARILNSSQSSSGGYPHTNTHTGAYADSFVRMGGFALSCSHRIQDFLGHR